MSIVFVRIDNRLIHGQVLEAWVPYVQADCIVVANDQAASNPFQKTLMEASVPRHIQVIIDSLEGVADCLAGEKLANRRVLLLLAGSRDALAIHRLGVDFTKLNLGNMHGGEGKQRVTCSIALDAADIENLDLLEADGVHVISQCLPLDREQDWRKLIQHLGR